VPLCNLAPRVAKIILWRLEVAPFSDPSDTDAPTDLSSPFPYPYIAVGMVMIREKGLTEGANESPSDEQQSFIAALSSQTRGD
jgi:hypothetical protein